MKLRIPMIVLALFAFTMTASAQVDVLWNRTGETIPAWFGTTNTERGMAAGEVQGESRIYVVSRTGGVNVRIVNAETGADVGTLSTTGVEGGFFGFTLNDIAVSDDGIIFGANLEGPAAEATPFKVYRWSTEASDPEVVISYTGLAERIGDRISVTGSAADNSLVLYAAAARSNQVVRFTTQDNGFSFDAEVVTLEGVTDAGIQPSVWGLADGSFYFNASPWEGEAGVNPMHFDAEGNLLGTLEGDWLTTNTVRGFSIGDSEFLAVYAGAEVGFHSVAIFDVTDGIEEASYLLSTPQMGPSANLFRAGDFHVVIDAEGDATIYAMSANTGLAAYAVAGLEGYFAGEFYVGEEGSAPNGADPHYATLGEAFADINERVPSGPITLLITSDLDERGTDVVLNQPAITEATPVVIRPAAGVDATVVLGAISADAGVDAQNSGLAIDNTSFVTIDGSNGSEDDGRNLTFWLEEGTGSRVLSVVRDADNVTIQNVMVEHEAYHTSGEGIRVRRANDAGTGFVPDNVVIRNNVIGTRDMPIKDGVGLFGTLGLSVGSTHVLDNVIYAGHRGITTFYNGDEQIYTGNTIHVFGTHSDPAWYGGVYLAAVENAVVSGNEIIVEGVNFATAGRYAAGVVLNVNIGDLFITNNMISTSPDFEVRGSTNDFGFYGVGAHRGTGEERYHVYHNSVRIGETAGTGVHAAVGHPQDSGLAFASTTKRFMIMNNIFVNEVEDGYGIHWRVSSEGGLDSDYNNLYAPEGFAGNWRGTDHESLSGWQFASGHDANSVSKAVEFVSETDLRLTGGSIGDQDLAGTGLAFVREDIDGTPRDETWPYMGAYEGSVWISIEDQPVAELPNGFEVHQNYPNPFNPTTTISYTLSQPADVTVRVYNVAGQLVQELVNGFQTQGRHEVRFNANDLASGVYLYRVQVGEQVQTRQMVLVK